MGTAASQYTQVGNVHVHVYVCTSSRQMVYTRLCNGYFTITTPYYQHFCKEVENVGKAKIKELAHRHSCGQST